MIAKRKVLKLEIDLVPRTSWGVSLKRKMSRDAWDKLRKQVHERNSLKCEICGSKNKLHCHEHWVLDDKAKTQKLVGLGTICNMCHHVTHFGNSVLLAREGHLDIEAVVQHFLKVNGCDRATFEEHSNVALALWSERSKYKWLIDFGEYARMLEKNAN